MTSRWAASLRLSWRIVRRSRTRSALIALLVAIPVFAGTFASVAIRTSRLSAAEAADRQLGRADAIVQVTDYASLDPATSQLGRSGNGDNIGSLGPLGRRLKDQSPARTDWASALPNGTRITPAKWTGQVRVTGSTRSVSAVGVVLDLHDPITHGMYDVDEGRVTDGSSTVAVTRPLAHRLHVALGDHVSIGLAADAPHPVRIEAIVTDPQSLSAEEVILPKAFADDVARQRGSGDLEWLVDTPSTAPDLHDRLAASGVIYETRAQWMDPAPALLADTRIDAQILIVLGTVAGFGLLEIVLLAGAAFAVGARRQSHDLGLLAAVGGDERDIRRTVLGQGLVLGVIGALIGIAAGAGATVVFRSLLERLADRAFGAFDAAAGDLVGLAVIGIVAGYLAAAIPARVAARRPVVDMLKERFAPRETAARMPRWAVTALVAGPAITVLSAYMWHRRLGDFAHSYVAINSPSDVARGLGVLLRDNFWPTGIWVGAAATLAGLVRTCPAVIARTSGVARHLPVSPRLATRDAARNRHRTAPAMAAVMTVIAGAVVVLFVLSSTDLRDRNAYIPLTPVGTIAVSGDEDNPVALHDATARVLHEFGGTAATLSVATTGSPNADPGLAVREPGCVGSAHHPADCSGGALGVVRLDDLSGILGAAAADARPVLAAGGAVYPCPVFTETGRVRIIDVSHPRHPTVTTFGNTYVPPREEYVCGLPEALISTETASAHGWPPRPVQSVVTPATTPSLTAVDRLQRSIGAHVALRLERGYQGHYSAVLLALFGAAGLATLLGTSIAVALAMAESRADMATLGAVGASPGRRRLHAMGQAAVVAGIGALLGLALGSFIAVATLDGSDLYPTSTPYRWLAVLLAIAISLAVGVAGLFTRSRLPLTRRLA